MSVCVSDHFCVSFLFIDVKMFLFFLNTFMLHVQSSHLCGGAMVEANKSVHNLYVNMRIEAKM